MQEAFPQSFGLSDHTLNNNACLGAVALGASVLESFLQHATYRSRYCVWMKQTTRDLIGNLMKFGR
jgi:N-acetylneuraminate synthase